METVVKIKNTPEGKNLLSYLKSLDYVQVMGNSTEVLDIDDIKFKVRKAEKSKSISLDEAIRQSEKWKNQRLTDLSQANYPMNNIQ